MKSQERPCVGDGRPDTHAFLLRGVSTTVAYRRTQVLSRAVRAQTASAAHRLDVQRAAPARLPHSEEVEEVSVLPAWAVMAGCPAGCPCGSRAFAVAPVYTTAPAAPPAPPAPPASSRRGSRIPAQLTVMKAVKSRNVAMGHTSAK
jgi:hypothetical protein